MIPKPLITARLVAGYSERDVLPGIDLSITQSEFARVTDANTGGKSTLLPAISCLVPRANGVTLFDGYNGLKSVAMALELATFWVF